MLVDNAITLVVIGISGVIFGGLLGRWLENRRWVRGALDGAEHGYGNCPVHSDGEYFHVIPAAEFHSTFTRKQVSNDAE